MLASKLLTVMLTLLLLVSTIEAPVMALGVAVSGSDVYAVDDDLRLSVSSLSDPESPVFAKSLAVYDAYYVNASECGGIFSGSNTTGEFAVEMNSTALSPACSSSSLTSSPSSPSPSSPPESSNVPIIAGATAGGVVIAGLLAGLVTFRLWKRSSNPPPLPRSPCIGSDGRVVHPPSP